MILAYDELVDFIASGPTREAVADFRASPETQAHVEELIRKEKTSGLSPEEKSELDHYIHWEQVLRLAKAKACFALKLQP